MAIFINPHISSIVIICLLSTLHDNSAHKTIETYATDDYYLTSSIPSKNIDINPSAL